MSRLDHHTSTVDAAQRWEQWHSVDVRDRPDPYEYADLPRQAEEPTEVRPVRTEAAA